MDALLHSVYTPCPYPSSVFSRFTLQVSVTLPMQNASLSAEKEEQRGKMTQSHMCAHTTILLLYQVHVIRIHQAFAHEPKLGAWSREEEQSLGSISFLHGNSQASVCFFFLVCEFHFRRGDLIYSIEFASPKNTVGTKSSSRESEAFIFADCRKNTAREGSGSHFFGRVFPLCVKSSA